MAFPVSPTPESGMQGEYGLTKREYFAAMAMQGLMADGGRIDDTAEGYAVRARAMADALIAELNKPEADK